MRAFRLPLSSLKEEKGAPVRYPYRAPDGTLLFEVIRHKPKGFTVVGRAQKGYVYRLPEMLASSIDEPVFWVEGEKDVETLRQLDLVAVTTSFGAYSYETASALWFKGRTVILLPDNDEPGEAYMAAVSSSLTGIARSVKTVRFPVRKKEDVSDWINYCGGSRPALLRLADLDFGEPRKSASGGREGGLGTVELAILKALKSRAHVATDMLPAIVAHFEAKQEWNTRAGAMLPPQSWPASALALAGR